ncbi:hypothetical protein [Arthrobacter sp. 260]|uniref:hypothetical protein n=1 Tax=Arthrobacter sp. 260 TaxID=2735314 RepID=UPI0014922DF0|nr:hypothetical protein [Arthrobacter sp. 260]NOJ61011.1 hypothetical protein [Arthrobacter sp. 260]
MQNPFTDESITPEQRRNRIWLAIAGALVFSGVISSLGGGRDDSAAGESSPAEQSTTQPPTGPDAPEREAFAAEINQAALDSFGIDSWSQTCRATQVGWPCFLSDMESPGEGDLVVLLQTSGTEEEADRLADDAAHALFKLVNAKERGLEWIQVIDQSHGLMTTLHYSEALPAG